MTTVSVLMSVHNGEDFIADAVRSVLDQTFTALELIVVDDASTDRTLALLRGFDDPRLVLVPLASNVGLVDALNLAASKATAPLLARIDADDLWHCEKLRLQTQAMESDASLVLLATAFEYIDGEGRVFRREGVHANAQALRLALLDQGNQLCHASIMMRADAFRAVGGYRKLAGRYAQDYDLWLRLIERGNLACLSDVLTQYRCHEQMLSITKLPAQRRAAEIYRVLAAQRRAGRPEDLEQAGAAVDAEAAAADNRLAGDYLRWMDLFSDMGRPDFAREMFKRALKTSPFGTAVRQRMLKSLQWRWAAVRRGAARGA